MSPDSPDIALINHQGLKTASGLQIQTPSPPTGLAYLGAYLKSHGHSYLAIDACGENLEQIYQHETDPTVMVQGLKVDEVIQKVPSGISIFGFSCLFSHSWPLVLDIVRRIRGKFPEALCVAGGEHPTALPGPVLQSGLFDTVVVGEGEETFLAIVEAYKASRDWRSLDGVAYLNEEGKVVQNMPRKRVTKIDDFPYPDWDSWSIENYISHNQVTGINLGRSLPILGSRGCPYACTFCSNPAMWTRRYIFRDPVSLVDEMEHFKNRYNLDGFAFQDLTFIVNRRKVLNFAKELINRDLKVNYQLPAGTRCEPIDEELCFALEESGLQNFALAPESGDPEVLERIKKQIDLDRFIEAARSILKTKMTVGCFFVIGFPEDNLQSLKNTLKLLRRLALLGVHDVTISQFTPYPGSEYFATLHGKGLVSNDYNDFSKLINFFNADNSRYCENLTGKQLYRWMVWMYLNFYLLSIVCRPWRLIYNLWVFWVEGIERTRYMRFFNEIFYLRRKWKSGLEDTTRS